MKGKIAVVTGGVKGIGKAVCDAFIREGAHVCMIDQLPNDYFTGDIQDPALLRAFAEKVLSAHGKIDYLINNACLSMGGINECSPEQFNYVLQVGVTAPYVLTQLFMNHFNSGGSIVNISSTRSMMSQPYTESYSAAKGAVTALTHALAVSLKGVVRVNAISPGWIDTTGGIFHGGDNAQHLVGRVGVPEDIVNVVLFLCSDKSSFITGQNLIVDGGMTKQMIYHNDFGWTLGKK